MTITYEKSSDGLIENANSFSDSRWNGRDIAAVHKAAALKLINTTLPDKLNMPSIIILTAYEMKSCVEL